jgi:hypothetical protein
MDPLNTPHPPFGHEVATIHSTTMVSEAAPNPHIFATPTNPRASLDGLSEELVLAVLKHLSDDSLSVSRFCLTNRRYSRIAVECLYECVNGSDWGETGRGHKVMRTIGKGNPLLGKYIKRLTVMANGDPLRTNQEQVLDNRALVIRVVLSAINVKALTISGELANALRDPEWIQIFEDPRINGFEHLVDVDITPGALGLMGMAPIFQLPAIQCVCLHRVIESSPIQTWKVPRSNSKVKRLAFDHSYLASFAVAQVLDSIQSLEEFHYSRCTPVRCQFAMRGDPRSHLAVQLSWPKVLEALRQHRDSLVDL